MVESNPIETLLYQSDGQSTEINVIFDYENETLWVTQKTMAELFNKTQKTISKHLNNIFNSGELIKEEVTFNPNDSTISGIVVKINPKANTQPILYNLDAIISVGYRVNSKEATQFRKWSTKILKEYMIKGFVLDTELLKNGTRFGKDYFDELLEKIKEIRVSERRLYQKVTDIFKECSYDYDKNSQEARDFYAKVQNKLHYAITGQTAAEIIHGRANHTKKHMGLTTWNNAPGGKILKSDVAIT